MGEGEVVVGFDGGFEKSRVKLAAGSLVRCTEVTPRAE